jgi:hypothetical protein
MSFGRVNTAMLAKRMVTRPKIAQKRNKNASENSRFV